MRADDLFMDTAFVQALIDTNDQHHSWARHILPQVKQAKLAFITEGVLAETAAALSSINRLAAARFIRRCYTTPNMRVVTVDHELFLRGLSLYESRADKDWSLVDCVSFCVMQENGVILAATTDHHFEQAGFRRLL